MTKKRPTDGARRTRGALWAAPLLLLYATQMTCSADRTTPDDETPLMTVDMRVSRPDLSDAPCTGLGCFVAVCPSGEETVVTGRVTAPNGMEPIRDALVYVPRSGAPEEFPPEVSCEVCNRPVGGAPVTQAVTDVDGMFELRRVPVTERTPIVIQKGRWRKVVYAHVGRCVKQGLSADETRLPRNKVEGSLPRMAVAVGEWDSIECVLKHIGLDQSEFTSPLQNGAVHLYDNEESGSGAPGGVNVSNLFTDLSKLIKYNVVFVNCSGTSNARTLLRDPQVLKNIEEYVRRGGRMYVTDYSYDFIQQVPEFAPFICYNDKEACTVTTPHSFNTATHPGKTATETLFTAQVDETHPGGAALTRWLSALPQPTLGGKVRIEDPISTFVLIRQMAQDLVKHPSTVWLRAPLGGMTRPVTVTFDYPAGEAACGRVLYSSYHTREHDDHSVTFPRYCPSGNMLPQEHVLEYLIFELSSCINPPG